MTAEPIINGINQVKSTRSLELQTLLQGPFVRLTMMAMEKKRVSTTIYLDGLFSSTIYLSKSDTEPSTRNSTRYYNNEERIQY
jgi:negative regulator of sigma E activity